MPTKTTVSEVPAPEFLALVLSGGLEADLQGLVRRAGDINAFYEEWTLLPALRLLGSKSDVRLVMIRDASNTLLAVFPFERVAHPHLNRVKVLKLWQHEYCFLCTPLVDSEQAVPAATAFGDWLESGSASASLIQFESFAVDGVFAQKFLPALTRRSGWVSDCSVATRALLQRGGDWHNCVGTKHAKGFRRVERRLRELGSLEYRALRQDEDCLPWIERFLELEARGWKGQSGTALGSQVQHRSYFREIAAAAHCRGRLQMLSMDLNGSAIAMKCNFLALPGSFSFKIAYDENYGKYSPGVLLELYNMEHIAAHCPEVEWMDSCAHPGHAMIERLWPDRRTIGFHLTTGRGLIARALVLAAPRYRHLKRMVGGGQRRIPSSEASA